MRRIATTVVTALVGVGAFASAATAQESGIWCPKGAEAAEKLGWRVGCQAYTFNRFTFYEAVDKVKALGLHYIEAYPGQTLSPDHKDVKFGHDLPEELRKEVLDRLSAADVKLVAYGVVAGLGNEEAAWRPVFEFAKAMGIETITAEPDEDSFELIDTLANEYQVNVAIHNHPQPSKYWNPDKVLEVLEGRSKRIGVCADTGHWMRSGIRPIEALRKLEGRIISFHFKDLPEMGNPQAHDVPWGTGLANVPRLLREMKSQGFQGLVSVEYEHNWENSLPDIAQSVANFDTIAASLSE